MYIQAPEKKHVGSPIPALLLVAVITIKCLARHLSAAQSDRRAGSIGSRPKHHRAVAASGCGGENVAAIPLHSIATQPPDVLW
jgi:hypothetical protein